MAALRLTLAALVLAGCTSGGGHGAAPGGVLDEQGFWDLVAVAAQEGGPAVDDRGAVMTRLLADAEPSRLRSWQQQLVLLDARLSTRAVEAAFAKACGGALDPDAFATARTWVVAQGRAAYERVVADPAELPAHEGLCDGSAGGFQDAALVRYSALGFEAGDGAFPVVDTAPPVR